MLHYYVYIVSNASNNVFYTGVTNNLERRVYQHEHKTVPGFTAKYNVSKLLYYEIFPTPREAIAAEKKIKGWTRKKKMDLILTKNPTLRNLVKD